MHCYVKCVENYSRKKGNRKTHAKNHKHILRRGLDLAVVSVVVFA